jgi:hypothetical protein
MFDNPLFALALLPVAFFAGTLAHELTHFVAARLLGVSVWFDPPTTVAYQITGVPRWRQRLIGLAPQLVGATVGLVWLALKGVPWSPAGLVGLAAWALWSVPGSWGDVSLAAAHGKTPWPVRRWRALDDDARLACWLAAGGFVAAGLAIAGAAKPILQPVSVGVLFGVAVVAVFDRYR